MLGQTSDAPALWDRDRYISSFAVQLMESLAGYSDAETKPKMTAMRDYLKDKLDAAYFRWERFVAENSLVRHGDAALTPSSAIKQPRPYMAPDFIMQYVDKDVYGRLYQNPQDRFTLTSPAAGSATASQLSHIIRDAQNLQALIRGLYFRQAAVLAVLSAVERSDTAALRAMKDKGNTVPDTFCEVEADPLARQILCPIVVIDPISGKGGAVYDPVRLPELWTPIGVMPGGGVIYQDPMAQAQNFPFGFTPSQKVRPESGISVESAEVAKPKPFSLPLIIAGAALAYFAVKA